MGGRRTFSKSMKAKQESTSASLLGNLDETVKASDLADRASYSQPQFFRNAKRELGQTPMSARRRLLMERAAYRLTRTTEPVTGIAFDATFESLEGFSRAFKKAFGLSPSAYRKLAPDEFQLDLSERLHYAPPPIARRQGEPKMNVPEIMIAHHTQLMGRYLETMAPLSDEILDAPMDAGEPFPWCGSTVTLREMASRASAFGAPWMHAINGIETDYHPDTVEKMRAALPVNLAGFRNIMAAVEKDGSFDLTFVDAVCEPPEVFSYGGVIAHVLTHTAYRQVAIGQHLIALGLPTPEGKDPIDFVREAQ